MPTDRDTAELARNRQHAEQKAAAAGSSEYGWGMQQVPDARVASPERLAYEAHARGDQLFYIDLVLSSVQGHVGIGTTLTRIVRDEPHDVLGLVEAQGWRLEQSGVAFVEVGSTATKRMLANAGSTEVANHGSVIGLFVFRRVASGSQS